MARALVYDDWRDERKTTARATRGGAGGGVNRDGGRWKEAILGARFGKTPADFKSLGGKGHQKADYDAMFTAENGEDETTLLATATAPPGGQ